MHFGIALFVDEGNAEVVHVEHDEVLLMAFAGQCLPLLAALVVDVGDDDAVAVSEMGWESVVVQRASRCCQSASCLQVCYALRWCSLGNDVVLWLCVIAYAQHGTVGLVAL